MMLFLRIELPRLRWSLLAGILAVTFGSLSGSAFADSMTSASQLLRQYPQALNMSGYILNAETNMNRNYSRQLQYGLSPLHDRSAEEGLIEIQGPLVPPLPQMQQNPFLLHTPRLEK
jgi:hypothetical protein